MSNSKARVSLDDVYNNSKCDGSMFKAVKMMAEEARFINEQANMGFIELNKKPTTIAMGKFLDERLEVVEEATNTIGDQVGEAPEVSEAAATTEGEELPATQAFVNEDEEVSAEATQSEEAEA